MSSNFHDRYRDKVILAPMVRAGTLPLRLLALKYGADLVYGEEIVDHRIECAQRVVNTPMVRTGTLPLRLLALKYGADLVYGEEIVDHRIECACEVFLAPMVRAGALPLRLLSLKYGADLVYGEEIVDHRIECAQRVVNSCKVFLAPMVRTGTLPLRLLALKYGADLVYGEEIVDHRIECAQRVVNTALGTIDFISGNDLIFRTAPELEKDRVVFQMGTNDAQRALRVTHLVKNDVSAIDINMGCPKSFSLSGGMGAALLNQPEKIRDILTTLVKADLGIPITCKIRVMKHLEDTLELVKMIESCGVSAIAVHGRQRDERPHNRNRVDEIRACKDALRIPVIANGGSSEIACYADIAKFRATTSCDSVMIGRTAQLDPRIFSAEHSPLPSSSIGTVKETTLDKIDPEKVELIKEYLDLCVRYDNEFVNTKYMIQRMMGGDQTNTKQGRDVLGAATVREIQAVFDESARSSLKRSLNDTEAVITDDGCYTLAVYIPNKRLKSQKAFSPKSALHEWCMHNGKTKPSFDVDGSGGQRNFFATVHVDGKRFRCSKTHTNIKLAEQAAALVALHGLQIRHLLPGEWEG